MTQKKRNVPSLPLQRKCQVWSFNAGMILFEGYTRCCRSRPRWRNTAWGTLTGCWFRVNDAHDWPVDLINATADNNDNGAILALQTFSQVSIQTQRKRLRLDGNRALFTDNLAQLVPDPLKKSNSLVTVYYLIFYLYLVQNAKSFLFNWRLLRPLPTTFLHVIFGVLLSSTPSVSYFECSVSILWLHTLCLHVTVSTLLCHLWRAVST